jgi:hypothetical protein
MQCQYTGLTLNTRVIRSISRDIAAKNYLSADAAHARYHQRSGRQKSRRLPLL